jgi:hypothetical protein
MTRDEIEKLTPDAVNAYLAENVLGWTDWPVLMRFEPASCLDDAMRAAEKVGWTRRRGDSLTFFELKYGSRWHAGWFFMLGAEHITASADTPALAVSRAVIAAHEAGKEKP